MFIAATGIGFNIFAAFERLLVQKKMIIAMMVPRAIAPHITTHRLSSPKV